MMDRSPREFERSARDRLSRGATGAALAGGPLYLLLLVAGRHPVAVALSDLALIAAASCAVMATLEAERRTRRRAWLLVAGYCGLWALGQALSVADAALGHRHGVLSALANVAHLGTVPLAVAASMQLPRRAPTRSIIALLDG